MDHHSNDGAAGLRIITREDCLALDAADPLRSLRDHFALDQADASGLVYLDGNSLGPLPESHQRGSRRLPPTSGVAG